MLFFTDVAVICCLPLPGVTPVGERTWHDTVEYRFGINASTESDADSIADHAARHAVDREGHYIGGVVWAVSTTPTTPAELDEYSDYLMRPISDPGIFYVSGVTYSCIGFGDITKFAAQLREQRRQIEQEGRPSPSFTHPQVADRHEPDVCRLVCPTCGAWIEYDQGAFFYAFIDGLAAFPEFMSRVLSARSVYDEFLARHDLCIAGDTTRLRYLHTRDDDFYTLDRESCEDVDPGITM